MKAMAVLMMLMFILAVWVCHMFLLTGPVVTVQ